MARFLSDEWLQAVRATGLSVGELRVECSVVGGPDGDVKLSADDDELGFGPVEDADVALTVPYAEATAIAQGALQPSVAFMQGRMKTAGDPGRLLELLAATATQTFRDGLERVSAATEY
jgi:hypothetical protein